MMYSVWDWNTGRYNYFRGFGEAPGIKAKPRFHGDGKTGVQLEDALPLLPSGAVKIGSGEDARGRVAIERSALGEAPAVTSSTKTFYQESPWLATGLLLGGIALFYKVLVGVAKGTQ